MVFANVSIVVRMQSNDTKRCSNLFVQVESVFVRSVNSFTVSTGKWTLGERFRLFSILCYYSQVPRSTLSQIHNGFLSDERSDGGWISIRLCNLCSIMHLVHFVDLERLQTMQSWSPTSRHTRSQWCTSTSLCHIFLDVEIQMIIWWRSLSLMYIDSGALDTSRHQRVWDPSKLHFVIQIERLSASQRIITC